MSTCLPSLLLILLLAGCSMPRIILLNDPLDTRQHNDLGVSYEQREEFDLALREYRRAAELDADWALPRFNLGNVHSRLEQWPQAIEAYQAALKIDPQSAPVMNNLAWALLENGEPNKGIALAEQAVTLDSANPSYWDTLAAAYQAAGRPAARDRAAREGLSLNPSPALRQALQDKLLNKSGLNRR